MEIWAIMPLTQVRSCLASLGKLVPFLASHCVSLLASRGYFRSMERDGA